MKRRLLLVLLWAILSTGCEVVFRPGLPAAPSGSGAAEIGVRYRYDLQTHCGLNTAPIVFDGSEWWIEGPTGYPNAPYGFANPVDEGTIILDNANAGTYRSSAGVERRLTRGNSAQPRPSYVEGCM